MPSSSHGKMKSIYITQSSFQEELPVLVRLGGTLPLSELYYCDFSSVCLSLSWYHFPLFKIALFPVQSAHFGSPLCKKPPKFSIEVVPQVHEWSLDSIYTQKMVSSSTRTVFLCSIPLINSLGSKFSSQGHFHSLQLLNVPQFLFSRVLTSPTN